MKGKSKVFPRSHPLSHQTSCRDEWTTAIISSFLEVVRKRVEIRGGLSERRDQGLQSRGKRSRAGKRRDQGPASTEKRSGAGSREEITGCEAERRDQELRSRGRDQGPASRGKISGGCKKERRDQEAWK